MFLIVCQVLKLASKVFCSPHTCSKLAKLTKEAKLKCKTLIRPVWMHWNTVTCMLGRTIDLSPILGNLCNMYQFNKDPKRGLCLQCFIVKDKEWTVLKDLHCLLDISPNNLLSSKACVDVIPIALPLRN